MSNPTRPRIDIVLKLRELRRMRGLTQAGVASISGVGEKTISSYETAARIASIKVVQLLRLLGAYDVSAADFFGGAVEQRIVREIEMSDLSGEERHLIEVLRGLPDSSRVQLLTTFLTLADVTVGYQARLRRVG